MVPITNIDQYQTSLTTNTSDIESLYKDAVDNIKQIQKENPKNNVFIVGGKQLYETTEPIVERVYLTRMKGAWFTDTRIDLERYLACFRIYGVRPGKDCTYEIWNRVIF